MDALQGLRIENVLAAQAEAAAKDDGVGQTDFLEMLVAQLENQDPLNPQDSADFAAQLAQFSSLEQLIGVREGVDALVALDGGGAGGGVGGSAASVDPASLVGRRVIVYGDQIEIDAAGTPTSVTFRTGVAAASARLRVLGADGVELASVDLRPTDPSTGERVPLRPGDHVIDLDPASLGLAEGVYAIDFQGLDLDQGQVDFLPMLEGVVSGAVLIGNPGVRIGERIFDVADVLEVLASETPR